MSWNPQVPAEEHKDGLKLVASVLDFETSKGAKSGVPERRGGTKRGSLEW